MSMLPTTNKWDGVLTTTLVACALITTGLVAYRQFFAPPARPAQPPSQQPTFIDNWTSHLGSGVRLGSPSAPVQLIEFADFECPACAEFHKTLKIVRERYPKELALSYVHYPLPMHRFAEAAARVAECADKQGRFEAMHDLLFAHQNALGLKPWNDFATESGIPDLATFDSCIQNKDPVPRIVEGQQWAQKVDVPGTPTLIVNGWKLGRPPSVEELDQMVQQILAGKSPVSSDGGEAG